MRSAAAVDRNGIKVEEVTTDRARVLFVDDSVVLRRMLKDAFINNRALEVFTSAPDSEVVLLNIAKARPQLAVIDADGDWKQVASLLTAVRASHQHLRIALITADPQAQVHLTERGRSFGVTACWLKTSAFRSSGEEMRRYILQQTGASKAPRVAPATSMSQYPSRPATQFVRNSKKTAVVIGVSTGGPEALSILLPMLPADFHVPILIVQHTLAAFTSLLVERLSKRTLLRVIEAEDGLTISGGCIIVAPGNRHMEIVARKSELAIALNEGPPENSCRPAVDPLFRSAAKVYGQRALGVVLTGMGQDGLIGARLLKNAGATVIAQDEASSTVWGMPGQVAQAGLADRVLALKDIAAEILQQTAYKARGVSHA